MQKGWAYSLLLYLFFEMLEDKNMLREKEIENTVGYIWINLILKKLEELELITGKELEATDKNISDLLNVEYKYSCRIV